MFFIEFVIRKFIKMEEELDKILSKGENQVLEFVDWLKDKYIQFSNYATESEGESKMIFNYMINSLSTKYTNENNMKVIRLLVKTFFSFLLCKYNYFQCISLSDEITSEYKIDLFINSFLPSNRTFSEQCINCLNQIILSLSTSDHLGEYYEPRLSYYTGSVLKIFMKTNDFRVLDILLRNVLDGVFKNSQTHTQCYDSICFIGRVFETIFYFDKERPLSIDEKDKLLDLLESILKCNTHPPSVLLNIFYEHVIHFIEIWNYDSIKDVPEVVTRLLSSTLLNRYHELYNVFPWRVLVNQYLNRQNVLPVKFELMLFAFRRTYNSQDFSPVFESISDIWRFYYFVTVISDTMSTLMSCCDKLCDARHLTSSPINDEFTEIVHIRFSEQLDIPSPILYLDNEIFTKVRVKNFIDSRKYANYVESNVNYFESIYDKYRILLGPYFKNVHSCLLSKNNHILPHRLIHNIYDTLIKCIIKTFYSYLVLKNCITSPSITGCPNRVTLQNKLTKFSNHTRFLSKRSKELYNVLPQTYYSYVSNIIAQNLFTSSHSFILTYSMISFFEECMPKTNFSELIAMSTLSLAMNNSIDFFDSNIYNNGNAYHFLCFALRLGFSLNYFNINTHFFSHFLLHSGSINYLFYARKRVTNAYSRKIYNLINIILKEYALNEKELSIPNVIIPIYTYSNTESSNFSLGFVINHNIQFSQYNKDKKQCHKTFPLLVNHSIHSGNYSNISKSCRLFMEILNSDSKSLSNFNFDYNELFSSIFENMYILDDQTVTFFIKLIPEFYKYYFQTRKFSCKENEDIVHNILNINVIQVFHRILLNFNGLYEEAIHFVPTIKILFDIIFTYENITEKQIISITEIISRIISNIYCFDNIKPEIDGIMYIKSKEIHEYIITKRSITLLYSFIQYTSEADSVYTKPILKFVHNILHNFHTDDKGETFIREELPTLYYFFRKNIQFSVVILLKCISNFWPKLITHRFIKFIMILSTENSDSILFIKYFNSILKLYLSNGRSKDHREEFVKMVFQHGHRFKLGSRYILYKRVRKLNETIYLDVNEKVPDHEELNRITIALLTQNYINLNSFQHPSRDLEAIAFGFMLYAISYNERVFREYFNIPQNITIIIDAFTNKNVLSQNRYMKKVVNKILKRICILTNKSNDMKNVIKIINNFFMEKFRNLLDELNKKDLNNEIDRMDGYFINTRRIIKCYSKTIDISILKALLNYIIEYSKKSRDEIYRYFFITKVYPLLSVQSLYSSIDEYNNELPLVQFVEAIVNLYNDPYQTVFKRKIRSIVKAFRIAKLSSRYMEILLRHEKLENPDDFIFTIIKLDETDVILNSYISIFTKDIDSGSLVPYNVLRMLSSDSNIITRRPLKSFIQSKLVQDRFVQGANNDGLKNKDLNKDYDIYTRQFTHLVYVFINAFVSYSNETLDKEPKNKYIQNYIRIHSVISRDTFAKMPLYKYYFDVFKHRANLDFTNKICKYFIEILDNFEKSDTKKIWDIFPKALKELSKHKPSMTLEYLNIIMHYIEKEKYKCIILKCAFYVIRNILPMIDIQEIILKNSLDRIFSSNISLSVISLKIVREFSVRGLLTEEIFTKIIVRICYYPKFLDKPYVKHIRFIIVNEFEKIKTVSKEIIESYMLFANSVLENHINLSKFIHLSTLVPILFSYLPFSIIHSLFNLFKFYVESNRSDADVNIISELIVNLSKNSSFRSSNSFFVEYYLSRIDPTTSDKNVLQFTQYLLRTGYEGCISDEFIEKCLSMSEAKRVPCLNLCLRFSKSSLLTWDIIEKLLIAPEIDVDIVLSSSLDLVDSIFVNSHILKQDIEKVFKFMCELAYMPRKLDIFRSFVKNFLRGFNVDAHYTQKTINFLSELYHKYQVNQQVKNSSLIFNLMIDMFSMVCNEFQMTYYNSLSSIIYSSDSIYLYKVLPDVILLDSMSIDIKIDIVKNVLACVPDISHRDYTFLAESIERSNMKSCVNIDPFVISILILSLFTKDNSSRILSIKLIKNRLPTSTADIITFIQTSLDKKFLSDRYNVFLAAIFLPVCELWYSVFSLITSIDYSDNVLCPALTRVLNSDNADYFISLFSYILDDSQKYSFVNIIKALLGAFYNKGIKLPVYIYENAIFLTGKWCYYDFFCQTTEIPSVDLLSPHELNSSIYSLFSDKIDSKYRPSFLLTLLHEYESAQIIYDVQVANKSPLISFIEKFNNKMLPKVVLTHNDLENYLNILQIHPNDYISTQIINSITQDNINCVPEIEKYIKVSAQVRVHRSILDNEKIITYSGIINIMKSPDFVFSIFSPYVNPTYCDILHLTSCIIRNKKTTLHIDFDQPSVLFLSRKYIHEFPEVVGFTQKGMIALSQVHINTYMQKIGESFKKENSRNAILFADFLFSIYFLWNNANIAPSISFLYSKAIKSDLPNYCKISAAARLLHLFQFTSLCNEEYMENIIDRAKINEKEYNIWCLFINILVKFKDFIEGDVLSGLLRKIPHVIYFKKIYYESNIVEEVKLQYKQHSLVNDIFSNFDIGSFKLILKKLSIISALRQLLHEKKMKGVIDIEKIIDHRMTPSNNLEKYCSLLSAKELQAAYNIVLSDDFMLNNITDSFISQNFEIYCETPEVLKLSSKLEEFCFDHILPISLTSQDCSTERIIYSMDYNQSFVCDDIVIVKIIDLKGNDLHYSLNPYLHNSVNYDRNLALTALYKGIDSMLSDSYVTNSKGISLSYSRNFDISQDLYLTEYEKGAHNIARLFEKYHQISLCDSIDPSCINVNLIKKHICNSYNPSLYFSIKTNILNSYSAYIYVRQITKTKYPHLKDILINFSSASFPINVNADFNIESNMPNFRLTPAFCSLFENNILSIEFAVASVAKSVINNYESILSLIDNLIIVQGESSKDNILLKRNKFERDIIDLAPCSGLNNTEESINEWYTNLHGFICSSIDYVPPREYVPWF